MMVFGICDVFSSFRNVLYQSYALLLVQTNLDLQKPVCSIKEVMWHFLAFTEVTYSLDNFIDQTKGMIRNSNPLYQVTQVVLATRAHGLPNSKGKKDHDSAKKGIN